ncbi:hypothetical protein LOK49_LG04G01940 [Camellia lanceoleosa]|uniref:Uncharacterized protein n=1 Tax=Camellia lanceoleosa TaxID=1840588 RepID=A0ACC0I176_9ERIC|nr:hypothetical protein LOK49_LG04G01940 [Camellia lanceoleosa]
MELDKESNSPEISNDSNELGSSEMADMMNSANINATSSGSKQKYSSANTLQNKRIIGVAALASSMDNLVNFVKTQSKKLIVNHVVGAHNYTMGQAVGRLYEIQGLDPADPLLHFKVMLMDVLNNREMVMSIPTDQGIIGWLQAKKQDKERNGGMNNNNDDTAQMNQMLDDVAALAIQWQHEMNCAYVKAYRIATDYYKAYVLNVPCRTSILSGRARITELYNGYSGHFCSAAEYRYTDMPDQDDLATLDDAMMPGDDDIEMAQLRARIRAELVAIWRNAR